MNNGVEIIDQDKPITRARLKFQSPQPERPAVTGAKVKVVEPNKGGRPLKYRSPEKLQQAVDKYFETERYPTVTGLQLYLDMTSATMSDYKKRDGFSSIIETAGRRVAKKYEERLIYGNGRNTAGIMFALKVGMGWREKAEEKETVEYYSGQF